MHVLRSTYGNNYNLTEEPDMVALTLFTIMIAVFAYLLYQLHLSNKAIKEVELELYEALLEYYLNELRKEPDYVAIYKEALTTNYRSTRSL